MLVTRLLARITQYTGDFLHIIKRSISRILKQGLDLVLFQF